MVGDEIIKKLPYSKPFMFVDEILQVNTEGIVGTYTFDPNLDFYKGHFKNQPITPGVILTETMAQIGLACFGIYLLGEELKENTQIAMTSTEMEFLKPVFPAEKVIVTAEKIYFRFGKLKCSVKMMNEQNELVCNGVIAGLMSTHE